MVRIFKAFIILILCQSSLPAQVRLLLDYNARTAEYTVSMMPEKTWRSPYNKTATGQITLKATADQFQVKEVYSHVADTEWTVSGRVEEPMESPGYDYIFFRLRTPGLAEMPYRAFKPTKLFTFTLESNCAREVMLVNNKEDSFAPPNSWRVNIGNSIGVLGANGEAYRGNVSNLPIFCAYAPPVSSDATAEAETETNKVETTEATLVDDALIKRVMYPNPTVNEVNITLDWKGSTGIKDILAYNSAGELVRLFEQNIKTGKNNFTLDLSRFENGIFNFLLVDENRSLSLGKIIKIQ